jgi:hypothetical protein
MLHALMVRIENKLPPEQQSRLRQRQTCTMS